MSKLDISRAIAEKQAVQLKKADLSAARVLEELRRLAFSDVRALFDAHGNLRPLQDLNDDEAACIASLEVIVKNAQAGDGHTDTIHKIKVWDKTRTLELLAKHFALLTDVVRHDGDAALIAALAAGRQRARETRKAQ